MTDGIDRTEALRRLVTAVINSNPRNREELESIFGQVWNTEELITDFTVHSFLAPVCLVTRKSDGADGFLTFQHSPRFYFAFESIKILRKDKH